MSTTWTESRPHLPRPILDGKITSTNMQMLTQRHLWCTSSQKDMYEPGQRELCGYFIPPFQRRPVWERERQQAFVESAYLGISLGTIIFNDAFNCAGTRDQKRYHRTDRWLIDGQQRLTALMAYVEGGMPIFLGTPHEHVWEDLNKVEQRTFWNVQMGLMIIGSLDEDRLRLVYDKVNFGGVPHREDERALAA